MITEQELISTYLPISMALWAGAWSFSDGVGDFRLSQAEAQVIADDWKSVESENCPDFARS